MASSRSNRLIRPSAIVLASAATLVASATLTLRSADEKPGYTPAAYAIKGAKIVTVSGPTIDSGTVVVRNGAIEAVGEAEKTAIPFDAEVIEGKGLVVYPGFIDLYDTTGVPAGTNKSQNGAPRTVHYSDYAYPYTPSDNRTGITPEFQVASVVELTDASAFRKLGITDILAAPGGAIAAGQSALVSTGGLPRRESLVRPVVGLHISLRSPSGLAFNESHDCEEADGSSAAYIAALAAAQLPAQTPPATTPGQTRPGTPAVATPGTPATPATPAPDENPGRRRGGAGGAGPSYPTSLMGVVAHLRQAMLDADHNYELLAYYEKNGGPRPPQDPALAALHAARTRSIPVYWEANTRDEIDRALDLADEFGTTAVIVGGRDAWKVADRLKAKDIPVILRLDFPEEPGKAPTTPAGPPGEARKKDEAAEPADSPKVAANKLAKWKERVACAAVLSKAGVRFAFTNDGNTRADQFHDQVRKLIAAGLPSDAAIKALTQTAAEIAGVGNRIGSLEKGKLGHLVAMSATYGDARSRVRYVLADGQKFDLDKEAAASGGAGAARKKGMGGGGAGGRFAKKADPDAEDDQPGDAEAAKTKREMAKADAEKAKADSPKAEPPKDAPKGEAVAKKAEDDKPPTPAVEVATELEEDRKPTIHTGGDVLIKDATILTVSEAGTISKGSILVRGGKIAAIGENLTAPEGVKVIDATGMVVMPGIIDTHSHMAVQGGVNEMSLSIVPEVRVADVVDSEDPTIYRALAGGTTAARLLHGSANTIGGQDVVIKLKHGQAARDLIIRDEKRPQGVKFALGENVTRRSGRFPNTRMGVEATIERAFEEGRAYKARMDAYAAAKAKDPATAGPPPRRDLRLEALGRIVDGSIKIHSHCYRSDEILMLLRVAEKYGVRVQSLQHVLEGYKVAPEIAAHGASASTFSDWWAYKIEAYDAIPFNAALLTEAGARVCIKSDSEELVRHLYLEGAKMVKYGAVPEARALEMITLNPARELGLSHRMGSIEVGKDADLAIFNAHPFDGFARCEMSLIDGEVCFQRKSADSKLTPRPGDHKSAPLASAEARNRSLEIATNPKGTYALTGATLHPVSGPDIEDGVLIVSGGRIAAIGGPGTPIPDGTPSIDLKGMEISPGMVDAGSVVGLFEIGSLQETQDSSDSAQFQPELRSGAALHPDSELIPVTRANGILASYVQPSGGTISGQGALAALDGWLPTDMILVDKVALNVTIPAYVSINPDSARARFGGRDPSQANAQRKERLDGIKEEFKTALTYDKVVRDALAQHATPPTPDPRLAALVPYAKGEKPVIFKAEKRVEILDALKLASELKLKAIISGGSEAWKVADAIKAANVPVILNGTLRIPGDSADPYDAEYANAAKLYAAGVTFAIKSGGGDTGTAGRNLPYEAATSIAYGLPEAEGLKAVTLAPAQILGVADKLGSLDVGKRADLVITAGGLLQPTAEVKALFVGGKPLPPESRHTKLYAKYRQRLSEVRSGVASIGLDRPSPTAAAPAADAARGGDR